MSLIERFAPVPDETFFSWLHRQSVFSEAFRYPLYMLLDDFERCSRVDSFDRDFDFGSAFAAGALHHLSLTSNQCETLFGASIWLLPQYNRRAFCWECLQEHVATVHYPCHLISWCSVVRTHCSTHSFMLREHPRSDRLSLNLGLGAFAYFCANKSKYDRDELHELFSSKAIADYCLRMASCIEMVKQSKDAKCSSYWRTCKILMQIMLIPSYGIISTILHRKREMHRTSNIWQALAYAPIGASSIDRALALLLVGIATRYFTESECVEIINTLGCSQYLDIRFYDRKTLGSACNVFTHENGKAIAQALTYSSFKLVDAPLEEFLAGFMRGLGRRR
ncbi:hypothetical protein KRR23_14430 [Pseudomonas sp. CVAP|uniref:hypothetical protein n=1 Tax=Pseudomonas sp. CVAP\|nr:hypothetical protein [Pseudomonas sp. CVAP\